MPIKYAPDANRVTRADGLRGLAVTSRYNPFETGAAKILTGTAAMPPVETPAQAWRRENSDLAEWIDRNGRTGDTTALRCLRQLDRHGAVEEIDVRAVARRISLGLGAAPAKPAVHVEMGALKASLVRAQERGEEWPSLSLDTFTFTLAAATARWPGAVYVKDAKSGLYLGRISDGEFIQTTVCSADQSARVVAAAADPAASAGAYGRLTGKCSCCRRKLTAAESIGRAVGPICWEKYFG
jgi:hypothetical protein